MVPQQEQQATRNEPSAVYDNPKITYTVAGGVENELTLSKQTSDMNVESMAGSGFI